MPTDDVHDHKIPQYGVVGEVDWRAFERLSRSIYRPKVVANTTTRSQYLTDLANLDEPIIPAVDNPVFVWRVDAGAGLELEVTVDGVNWRTYPTSPGVSKRDHGDKVTLSVSNSVGTSQAVAFPAGKFTEAPNVIVSKSAASLAKFVPYAHSVTTAGCTVGIYAGDGVAATGSVSVTLYAWQD